MKFGECSCWLKNVLYFFNVFSLSFPSSPFHTFWVLQYSLDHKIFLSAVSHPIAQTAYHDGFDSHELIKCVPCMHLKSLWIKVSAKIGISREKYGKKNKSASVNFRECYQA